MAKCRIYLFTYQRNHLLPRAIESILKQTFVDWICEVHNDDPADHFPSDYVNALNDDRFSVQNHPKNLGAVASFNLAFNGCDEEYVSILEDDNWWEETFLAEMIKILSQHKHINVAWANMHLWQERTDGSWKNLEKSIWPFTQGIEVFNFPNKIQAMGAIHSNGAMLYRSVNCDAYRVPKACDFNIMEAVRERTYQFPLLLVKKTLANFSITKETARENNHVVWTCNQVMLLASYILTSKLHKQNFEDLLNHYRKKSPSPVINFFLCNLFYLKKSSFYFKFNLGDWFQILKWLLKRGHQLRFIKNYLHQQKNIYDFLYQNTAERYLALKSQ